MNLSIRTHNNRVNKISKLYQENFWGVLQYKTKTFKSIKKILLTLPKKKKFFSLIRKKYKKLKKFKLKFIKSQYNITLFGSSNILFNLGLFKIINFFNSEQLFYNFLVNNYFFINNNDTILNLNNFSEIFNEETTTFYLKFLLKNETTYNFIEDLSFENNLKLIEDFIFFNNKYGKSKNINLRAKLKIILNKKNLINFNKIFFLLKKELINLEFRDFILFFKYLKKMLINPLNLKKIKNKKRFFRFDKFNNNDNFNIAKINEKKYELQRLQKNNFLGFLIQMLYRYDSLELFKESIKNLKKIKKKTIQRFNFSITTNEYLKMIKKLVPSRRKSKKRKKKKVVRKFFKITQKAFSKRRKIRSLSAKAYINKQKLKKFYGNLNEKQFSKLCKKALKIKLNVIQNFLFMLESRLDSLLYRVNFAKSLLHSKQIIKGKNLFVNGLLNTYHGYNIRKQDIVNINPKLHYKIYINLLIKLKYGRILYAYPKYLEINYQTLSIIFSSVINEGNIPYTTEIYPSLVLKYYY